MENATQALFMAAGVLIAVIIISLSVFLFSSASRVSENYDMTMSEIDMTKFNSQFSKFNTANSTNRGNILENTSYNVASDLVSAINLAYSLNEDYNYDVQRGIQVVIKGVDSSLKPTGNEDNQIRNYTFSTSIF